MADTALSTVRRQRHRPDGRFLPWAPLLTLLALLGPVAAGVLGTVLPAWGYMPVLGGHAVSLAPLRGLADWPGLPRAATLSLTTGLASTLLALAIVTLICATLHGTRAFRILQRALSPLLSVPHAAAAFGLAFLIAPSGLVARLLAPLAGWDRPPDVLIVQDPLGLALIAGLTIKEVPFLLLMSLAALSQVQPAQSLIVARALGYGPAAAWLKTVFPRVYMQIRLPVFAVLAYAMSVIDVALILGPNTPPTLSVQVLRWMNDPDLTLRFQAAAGALLQLVLVLGGLGLWVLGERGIAALGRRWIARGQRRLAEPVLRATALGLGLLATGAVVFGMLGLAVWSVSGLWRYPDLWPDAVSLRTWMRAGPALWAPLLDTVLIAGSATLLALTLTLACLEAEHRYGLRPTTRALWLLYVPLIVPQVSFLAGLQMLAILSGLDGNRPAVIAAHVVFVLPYVFLSLGDPFRAWDRRMDTVARALGAGRDGVLWRVRLPMLLRPVLTACAVGFAVSVGQFLPTLLIGAGRVQTLTTEAVALASGGDRRLIGATALAQTGAALLPFAMALALPALLWRNRRGLRDA